MNRFFRTMRSLVRGPVLAVALCTGAVALAGAANAFAAPVIDGNIDDMITYANGLQSGGTGTGIVVTDKPDINGDPTPETIYNDLKFIPCPQPQPQLGSHWVNGVEIFRHVLAYTPGSTTLYLGLRSEGIIGDGDGNGNPDNAGGGSCNPNDNIEDTIGISGNELYAWSFDLNCDGVTDGQIKIEDNAIVGTGTMAGATGDFKFRAGGIATGKDLELAVTLPAPLPPAFRFVRVEANAFDGLSEDRSDGGVSIANPAITIAKSATPTSVCVGQKTRFTITVNNTGQTPLAVDVVDQLPAQLTYAANLSSTCNVGAPNVNGQVMTFPTFNLAAGASCQISFDAQASLQCFGTQNNIVDATGTFSSACIAEGGAVSKTAHAEFAVTCVSAPCVEVKANGPQAACPGAPVLIGGTATNCSQDPEQVVIKVNGVQAYNAQVGAGQTIKWSLKTTMPEACTAGQNSSFAIEATATGACGTDTKNTTVLVRCKDKPCVQLTANPNPLSACPGDKITISGNVKNCSLDPETITVTIDGVQVLSQVVDAGVTLPYTKDVTMPACTAGQSVTFNVKADATGDCPPAASQTVPVNVLCKNPPCASVTAQADKQAACPNEAVKISGTVKNCGKDPANYVVTVAGVQVFTGQLAAGAEAQFQGDVNMGACTANQQVGFPVVATATNACGQDTKSVTPTVRCKDKPCVELTADRNPASACPGDAITISGTVKNCSLEPETIAVTVNGEQVFNELVAPGETKPYQKNTTMPQCTAGKLVDFVVHATASGDCPPVANAEQTVSVACKNPPCVSVTAQANKAAACPNEAVIISGTVKNCGTDAADYTVTVGGVQVFAGNLAAGAEAPFQREVNMGACVGGNNVTWTVVAHASNSCGNDEKQTDVSVRCKDLPCVELVADRNPASACPGDAVKIFGTVKNCSLDPETIVVTVNGEQVLSQVVQPGVTVQYEKNTVMPACTAGKNVDWNVVALATNDCDQKGVRKEATVSVQCKNPPCVSVTAQANKAAACPNEAVVVSGTVKNCGTDAADYTVTVGGVQVFAGNLAAGAEAPFQREVNMGACVAGNNVTWTVVAHASNSCGNDEKQTDVSVRCKDLPCVELTADRNPASACPGEPVKISGTVKNCSIDPETIVVTVNGEQVLNQEVAAGQTVQYEKNTVMPACTAGKNVDWNVVAIATNDCDKVGQRKEATVSVQCKNPPCVDLIDVKADVAAACPGAPVHISGTVKNCGTDAADYTVSVGGVQVFAGNLAAGATAQFSRDVNMGECVAGNNVTWDVTAHASNSCGNDDEKTSVSVRCKDVPCVELVAEREPETACPGAEVHIHGTVKNCSLDPETIVVTVNGAQVYNQLVQPGATVPYETTLKMPECTSGQAVPFTVVATATGDCGQPAQKTANLSVICRQGPCVQASASCNPPAACPGTPITVTGSAKNCGLDAEDITITIEGQQKSFPGVAPGETVSWNITVALRECTSGEQVTYNVSATATNACGSAKPSTASCSVLCQKPQVQIDETVSPSGAVDQGTVLHYSIVVTNPSKDVALSNVKVTDELCDEATFEGNVNPAATSAPAVGASGGTIVWDIPSIPAGGSVTLTFDAKIKTLESPACEADNRSCTNHATVVGNCVDAQARAEDSVVTPINPCPKPGLCRLTGGGCMNDDPDTGNKSHKQNTFGGNSSPEHDGGGPTGNSWEHVLRDGKTILFNWHSWDAHVIACSVVPPGPCSPKAINTRADFVGTGKYSIGAGGREEDGNMVAYIVDHKEGSCNKGTRDEYFITVRKGLVIGQGEIVFDRGGFIDCGNLQIHETPARLFGSGITTGEGVSSVELINRPYPNPFSGTTNFAYKVAEGGQTVDVGVYNVAGRLVKSLAQGSQNAGTYTVTWDGTDAQGVRMAPGVYFLKSRVGNDQSVNRLIYVSR